MALFIYEATLIYKVYSDPLVLIMGLVLYQVQVVIQSWVQWLVNQNLEVLLGYLSVDEHTVYGLRLFDLTYEAIAFLWLLLYVVPYQTQCQSMRFDHLYPF